MHAPVLMLESLLFENINASPVVLTGPNWNHYGRQFLILLNVYLFEATAWGCNVRLMINPAMGPRVCLSYHSVF